MRCYYTFRCSNTQVHGEAALGAKPTYRAVDHVAVEDKGITRFHEDGSALAIHFELDGFLCRNLGFAMGGVGALVLTSLHAYVGVGAGAGGSISRMCRPNVCAWFVLMSAGIRAEIQIQTRGMYHMCG